MTIICQLSIIERLIERNRRADMAQLVERVLGKDEVTSSNLVSSSMKTPDQMIRRFSFTVNRDLCREMAIENYFHPLPVDF